MKWCRTISPGSRLRDIRLCPPASVPGPEVGETAAREGEQAAFVRGLAEGEKRLSEQLLRQRAEVLELQNGVLTSLRQAASQVVRQSESAVIQLALEVAQRLVAGLPISADMIEAAVRSALAKAEEATEFDIFLHADDLALLRQCNAPVLLPGPGQEALRFHASEEVSRGGCLVETRFGIIDARRETKMALIQQSLGT